MFYSLKYKVKLLFKNDQLIAIRINFWIVTVQDWSKTSPANAVRQLGTLKISNDIDIVNLLVIKNQQGCVFDNQQVSKKNGKNLITEHSQWKLK